MTRADELTRRKRLTTALGYEFADPDLLTLALTHRSASGSSNNERLEYLGDAILNFLVGEYLYQRLAREREGELSRIRATLVRGETLALLARQFDIGAHLILGPGEMKSGGHRRDSILADAMEAVLGAVYLDSGSDMAVCRQALFRWFDERMEALINKPRHKDAKSQLQEFLQGRGLELPLYAVAAVVGDDHDQLFHVVCQVQGLSEPVTGSGGSRRQAEQEAARNALERLGIEAS